MHTGTKRRYFGIDPNEGRQPLNETNALLNMPGARHCLSKLIPWLLWKGYLRCCDSLLLLESRFVH